MEIEERRHIRYTRGDLHKALLAIAGLPEDSQINSLRPHADMGNLPLDITAIELSVSLLPKDET